MKKIKKITRFHNFVNKLTEVDLLGEHYAGYLEDRTYVGWIPASPDTKKAFKNEDWQFFSDAFGLVN